MSDDELIRRGDALAVTVNEYLRAKIAALPAVQPAPVAPEMAALVEAAKGLAEVLNRNRGKGPIPDVELMFCWLAAQTVCAALAALEGRA